MRPCTSFNRKVHKGFNTLASLTGTLILLTSCAAPATTSTVAQVTQVPPASTATKTTVNGEPTVNVGPASPAPAPTVTNNPNPTTVTPGAAVQSPAVTLRWFGQSTFLLTSSTGTRILMDPAGASTGYNITPMSGIDAVTVTHEHSDHNNVSLASGNTTILRGLTSTSWANIDLTVKGVRISSYSPAIPFYHDNTSGTARGRDTVFIFEVDGLRIVHMGDIGHTMSPDAITALGRVDVLLIPVGGFYTVDAAGATTIIDQLKPKIVVPMHYKTPRVPATSPLATADAFLAGKTVQRPNNTTISISKSTLPAQTTVYVLNYE